ncbi:MAG: hypothetical protein KGY99_03010 [Phycisphaerae bacterium]|nr:hypothetical protein [Phycisphaerae bacterium]
MKYAPVVCLILGVAVGAAVVIAAFAVWHPACEAGNTALSPEEVEYFRAATKAMQRLETMLKSAEAELTEVSAEAEEACLMSDLQTLRSQIELYRVQHNDRYPGQGAGETVEDVDPADFVADLTGMTNAAGTTDPDDGEVYYGPYLRSFPTNPFVDGPAGAQVTIGSGPVPPDRTTGWYFDTNTGVLHAGDAEHSDL